MAFSLGQSTDHSNWTLAHFKIESAIFHKSNVKINTKVKELIVCHNIIGGKIWKIFFQTINDLAHQKKWIR